jgi:hypothetical protein
MGKAVILSLVEIFMLESTPGERQRDMDSILGPTATFTLDSFSTDRKMDREAGRRVIMMTPILIKAIIS